jgi:glucose uptake protein GlcU
VAAGPGCLAGFLWSIGNYLSILAVVSLGMAVGWPLVQCSLIVSNVWALFYYREVEFFEGHRAIVYFLASSSPFFWE